MSTINEQYIDIYLSITKILSFLFASIGLTLLPGPDIIYVIIESASKGFKTGFYIALGLVSGIIFHTTIAATGLSLFFINSPSLFNIIKIFGVIYLLYLAYLEWKDKENKLIVNNTQIHDDRGFFQLYRRGILMNILNPKVTLFFIAFLPQFISKSSKNYVIEMYFFGFIFMLQAIIIFALVAAIAGKMKSRLKNPNFTSTLHWIKIIFLVGLAVLLGLNFE